MKAITKKFVGFATSLTLVAAVHAQDKSAASSLGTGTNSATRVVVVAPQQPTLRWSDHTQASGLFVDCAQPWQTWNLLNPAVPARVLPKPDLFLPPPAVIPRPISGTEDHEPNFAVLRFSFP